MEGYSSCHYPNTTQKEYSSKRLEPESLDMAVYNIHPSKKIKKNNDKDGDDDVTIIEKKVSLVDKVQNSLV